MREPEGCPAGDPAECPFERRSEDPRWRAMTERLDGFDASLKETHAIAVQVKQNTDDIITLFGYGRGFLRVMAMIGKVGMWLAKMAAVGAVVWAIFRYGVLEVVKDAADAAGGGHKP